MGEIPDPNQSLIDSAKRTLDIEAAAVAALGQRIDATFVTACQLCLSCEGRIIVTGMGKSGHIGSKIAATLASTGSPAFFVHPGEASHGDLGMVTVKDVVIALSNSGETDEVLNILPLIQSLRVPLISMTGNPTSSLAQAAQVNLDTSVAQEACPLQLAPTASTTATLALGDALALALMEAKGFTAHEFALSHPGGSLGRRLILKVEDIMHTGERLPAIAPERSLRDALFEMTAKGLGLTAIVDPEAHLLGVFTDGDLRRHLDQPVDLAQISIQQVMTSDPVTIRADQLAAEAVSLMEQHKISAIIVVDAKHRAVGALNMHDLFAARIM